jgi:hypothetical protein
MNKNKVNWSVDIVKIGNKNHWSFGLGFTSDDYTHERYLFINLFYYAIYIGKLGF